MRPKPLTRGVWVLALVVALLAAWTTTHETRRWRKSPFGDFNYLRTGAQCLVAGCDPYDYAALNHQGEIRHERRPIVWPMTPVYPASSLLLMLPYAPFAWPLAAYVFDATAGLAAGLACVLMVCWLRIRAWDAAAVPLVAMLVTIPMAAALEFGNPALLEAGLATLACLLLLETQRTAMGWVALGLALALKPQLSAGAWFVLVLKRETRGAAVKAGALAVGLLLAGLVAYRWRLGSFHYLATLKWVLWLSALPGGSSDFANNEAFDFLNIQTAIATLPHVSRGVVSAVAWAITAAMAVAAAVVGWKRDALRLRPWTMVALGTAISVLPVYHRGYDRVIVLLLIPAVVEVGRARPKLAWVYAALLTWWVANDTVTSHILKRWQFKPQNGIEDVLFCGVLLASLWWMRGAGEADGELIGSKP